jgi:hypothetical protein
MSSGRPHDGKCPKCLAFRALEVVPLPPCSNLIKSKRIAKGGLLEAARVHVDSFILPNPARRRRGDPSETTKVLAALDHEFRTYFGRGRTREFRELFKQLMGGVAALDHHRQSGARRGQAPRYLNNFDVSISQRKKAITTKAFDLQAYVKEKRSNYETEKRQLREWKERRNL